MRVSRGTVLVVLILSLNGCASLHEKNAALLEYSAEGQTEKVEMILNRGAEVNTVNKYGDTPLHLAIKNHHPNTAALLIDNGADINAIGALDDTPLHVSIYTQQEDISMFLISKGADESLLNLYGLAPQEMQAVPEIEEKIISIAGLINLNGSWIDRDSAQKFYRHLKLLKPKFVTNSLVLQVINNPSLRLKVLIVAIKLGVVGSEGKLASLLMIYGNKSMAEDYINSGSALLAEAGIKWARDNGYRTMAGPGSHRASWGRF